MFAYQADLYCDDCGDDIRAEQEERVSNCPALKDDSDAYPQWAPDDSESDCPQHCAACGVFLENPLTDEGIGYVVGAVQEFISSRNPDNHYAATRGDATVIKQWVEYYDIPVDEVFDIVTLSDVVSAIARG